MALDDPTLEQTDELIGLSAQIERDVAAAAPSDPIDIRRVTDAARAALLGEAPPPRVGRFVVLERLGKGAMGSVFSAYDPKLDRRVAVKVLHREDPDERLVREARAIARLNHPNVLALYDVGEVDGRTFLAMEYVEGSTLREWLEKERTRGEVMRVFADASRGLAAAHQSGLVHRDFKPDNVMVGDDGRVRVLDFGLARAGGAAMGTIPDAIGTVSETGVAGTPAYMAPEQMTGGRTTARSDQWAFCVALHEALVGSRPFQSTTLEARLLEMERPYRAPASIPKHLARVLERGLQREPAQRFPDMTSLANALERRSPQRSRGLMVLGGGAIAAAIAIAGSGTSATMVAAGPSCDEGAKVMAESWSEDLRARVQARLASAPTSYARESAQRTVEALDRWSATWAAEYDDACADTWTRGEASESALDRRMACLDDMRRSMHALAMVLAEETKPTRSSEEAARSLGRPVVCAAPREPTPERPWLDGERRDQGTQLLDAIARAAALRKAGRYREAVTLGETTLAQARAFGDPSVEADVQVELGRVYTNLGEDEQARVHLEPAIARHLEDARDRSAALALIELAVAESSQGHFDAARRWTDLGLALARRADLGWEQLADTLHVRGTAELEAGRYDDALDYVGRALELRRDNAADDYVGTTDALQTMANIYSENGNAERAAEMLREVLERRLATSPALHPAIGTAYLNLGAATVRFDPERAIDWYAKAVEELSASLGPDHRFVAVARGNRANALADLERYDEAIVEQDAAIEALLAASSTAGSEGNRKTSYFATFLDNRSTILRRLGRLDEAERDAREGLEIRRELVGDEHIDTAYSWQNVGRVEIERGNKAAAVASLERAVAIRLDGLGPDHIETKMAVADLEQARSM